jgi:hypothetical protein
MTSAIDPALAGSLEQASATLIERINTAIRDFYERPPQDWEAWETWRTPRPWEARALPNLAELHDELQAARRSHQAGDIRPITLVASSYKGLSKDLDFDFRWMTDRDRLAVEEAIGQIVLAADQIHRLGYHELERTGRL